MYHTYHIHIKGLVQGVGFRPFVYRIAASLNIKGWVSNTNDGVHIEVTAAEDTVKKFYHQIINHPPVNAVITSHSISEINSIKFNDFEIQHSTSDNEPDLLLTPDIAICDECKNEISNPENKRYGYAFTTCLNCGPRYSIIQALPYDRVHTTMAEMPMCESCASEYTDINNRRHYSQTNSCTDCAIHMHLYESKEKIVDCKVSEIIPVISNAIKDGKILAVKGMGGYLLICDATNEKTIFTLRERKLRPAKPFALLYRNIEMAEADVHLYQCEINELQSKAAPIVLCRKKITSGNDICTDVIAPGLDKIGVMLPSSPLLSLLEDAVGKPMIATSANISGSPIIYKDEAALENLFDVANMILTYDREIVAPQDDSVIQFSEIGQKIILRRSRGLAPNYFPVPFEPVDNATIFAAGGELKSAFALLNKNNLYISQYLGDQGTLESQESYVQTLQHFMQLLQCRPDKILVDLHPAYAVSQLGKAYAAENIAGTVTEVQHHMAHLGAVLAENNLLNIEEPVLGYVWDGTGYGADKQIWGGEIFIYQQQEVNRIGHLKYFPQIVGDKMSKEPRLSALSLLKDFPAHQLMIQKYFSQTEWAYYQKMLQQEHPLMTSSMGRFLDGLACMLGIRMYNAYEGEAAMQMEALARACHQTNEYYLLPLLEGELYWDFFLQEFIEDIQQGKEVSCLARKIFQSLAKAIAEVSDQYGIDKLAFSGGVFQNALLVDLVIEQMAAKKQLYFHQQLSPNDECIGFGQLACYQMEQQLKKRSSFTFSKTAISL